MSQPVRVDSKLDLLFLRMEAYEELGRMFRLDLDLLSPHEDLNLDDMLGEELTVELDLPRGGTRYFHGIVSEFSQVGRHGDYASYRATVHPWLWFLTQKADCRIFQMMTVPEIIKQVFDTAGFSDYDDRLCWEDGNYRQFEYCVQYRETDFNFVSRLMEQEGIYYYFDHEKSKHKMVWSDAGGSHDVLKNDYGYLPYFPPTQSARDEHIYDWALSKAVRTGKAALRAYNFTDAGSNLEVKAQHDYPHAHKSFEVFDYPGEHLIEGDGNRYVQVRMEELACDYERMRGESNARGIYPGGLFELTDCPRYDQNREYLVTKVRHSVSVGDYASAGGEGFRYNCSFEAIDSVVKYRPHRLTPKPTVQGLQTAKVVGPAGDEIFTDEYGRVKVQFPWDRYGQSDENSSCWIRVAQIWAGGQWGGMAIPRIDQEVIVDFIEGDPDRPIITGRVYNSLQMPPYALPANKTQSGLKSRSTKGGSGENFNEIRFEDLKDSEEIYIHAEKDHNTIIENNQTIAVGFDKEDPGDRALAVHNDEATSIGRDRSKEVGRDQYETIARNKTIEVGGGHNEQVAKSMTVMVGSNLTETVGVNYSETVGAAMELIVGAAMVLQVGAVMSESVGGSKSESVGSSKSLTIGKSRNETIGSDLKLQVGKDSETAVGGTSKTSAKKNYIVQADKIQITAKNEISLKAGSAQITMKKNGDVTIKGKKINVKGSGDVILKGSKIKEN